MKTGAGTGTGVGTGTRAGTGTGAGIGVGVGTRAGAGVVTQNSDMPFRIIIFTIKSRFPYLPISLIRFCYHFRIASSFLSSQNTRT